MGAISDIATTGDWTRDADVAARDRRGDRWLQPDGLAGLARLPARASTAAIASRGRRRSSAGCCSASAWCSLRDAAAEPVRLGAGNLKALVVRIVLGWSAFATLKGITPRSPRDGRCCRHRAADEPGFCRRCSTHALRQVEAAWALIQAPARRGRADRWSLAASRGGRARTLLAGLGIGGVVVTTWWGVGAARLSRRTRRRSTSLPRDELAAHGVAELRRAGGLHARLAALFSDKTKVMTLGIARRVGVVAGSALQALLRRALSLGRLSRRRDTANHLVGGLLDGRGRVTGLGCTIGQGSVGRVRRWG